MIFKAFRSLTLVGLLSATPVQAIDMGEVQEFVETIGYNERIEFSISYYKNELKKNYPGIPAEFWSEAFVEVEDWYRREAMEAVVQSYASTFSDEELTELIELYRTPQGKRIMELDKRAARTVEQSISQVNNQLTSLLVKVFQQPPPTPNKS